VQAEVEGVEDEAAAGDAEVRLHVLVVVPAERRDAVAALEADGLQRDRQLLRPPRHVAPRVTVEALVGQAGDDLLVAEERLGAPQQRRQRQLEVHHQPLHCRNRPRFRAREQEPGCPFPFGLPEQHSFVDPVA
jgi:hypothetical protein